MFQGYYNLTSSMLTQTRNLNVTSNNMTNVSTPGYRADKFIAKSFEEELAYRSTNKAQEGAVAIGEVGRGIGADRNYTNFVQGGFEFTTNPFDFAITGEGFFTVQTDEGNVYTRNGSFSLDEDGYLMLRGIGPVLGQNGAPILLGRDDIEVDKLGNIYAENGNFLGSISLVNFANYDEDLVKTTGDVFWANAAPIATTAEIMHKTLETSNVEAVKEMTDMMASQRALQSSSQILSMYDQLIGKIVSELGPTT